MKPQMLYHGSSKKLESLEPQQASGVGAVSDQQVAIYATHDKTLAIAFAMRGNPDQNGDLEWELKTNLEPPQIIYSAGTPRIGEIGFLYVFSSDGFEKIDEWQWIARDRILPISVEKFQVNDFLHWVSYTTPHR